MDFRLLIDILENSILNILFARYTLLLHSCVDRD